MFHDRQNEIEMEKKKWFWDLLHPVRDMGKEGTIVSVPLLSRIFRIDGFMTGTIDMYMYI